jgi:hypothetical protein
MRRILQQLLDDLMRDKTLKRLPDLFALLAQAVRFALGAQSGFNARDQFAGVKRLGELVIGSQP